MHSFPEWSETFLLRQVTGLLDRGHDVQIFCDEPASGSVVHADVERYDLYGRVRHVQGKGVSTRRVRATVPAVMSAVRRAPSATGRLLRPRSHGGFGPVGGLRLLCALGRAGRFDLAHAHYGDLALRYAPAARVLRAPFIASFYGYDCSHYPRRYGESVFLPLFDSASAVTALGPRMAGRLRELGCPAHKLRIQHIGVDVRAFPFRPRTALGDPRILTVARLVAKKGIGTVIRALPQLLGTFPRLRYRIVGDGPERAGLDELASALGVRRTIEFLGAQSVEVVAREMAAADVFVLASTTAADGDEEGTPTALMEALSSGLPVVSTRHSGIPEIIMDGRTGILVEPDDTDALAAAVHRVLEDADLRARLVAAGREHVERHFEIGRLSEDLEALYRDVIDARTDVGFRTDPHAEGALDSAASQRS